MLNRSSWILFSVENCVNNCSWEIWLQVLCFDVWWGEWSKNHVCLDIRWSICKVFIVDFFKLTTSSHQRQIHTKLWSVSWALRENREHWRDFQKPGNFKSMRNLNEWGKHFNQSHNVVCLKEFFFNVVEHDFGLWTEKIHLDAHVH